MPPTFIPTPIGPPPGPPTAVPTPGLATSPTASPPVTITATPGSGSSIQFSLEAARLSRVNNPGNLQGLREVRPGTRVWLMMYYTVHSLPRSLPRLTRYTIFRRTQVLYRVAYSGKVRLTDQGKRLSRYTTYVIPKTLSRGRYVYRAVLQIGKRHQTKVWPFMIGSREQTSVTARPPGSTRDFIVATTADEANLNPR
ncbi:MAG: hypothetical protein DLM70_10825 [Chloroflexi bacterium]|nr:MAG: hypothetical protein DLM70_10825 [Chloroflexota bacterium]